MEMSTCPKIRWVERVVNGKRRSVLQYRVDFQELAGDRVCSRRSEWQDVPVEDPDNPGVVKYPMGGPYHDPKRNPAVERLEKWVGEGNAEEIIDYWRRRVKRLEAQLDKLRDQRE